MNPTQPTTGMKRVAMMRGRLSDFASWAISLAALACWAASRLKAPTAAVRALVAFRGACRQADNHLKSLVDKAGRSLQSLIPPEHVGSTVYSSMLQIQPPFPKVCSRAYLLLCLCTDDRPVCSHASWPPGQSHGGCWSAQGLRSRERHDAVLKLRVFESVQSTQSLRRAREAFSNRERFSPPADKLTHVG